MDDDAVLDGLGTRLRSVREREGSTLAALSASTGISVSTLSRLESGQRRASLELLLPLARAYQMPLQELIGAPTDDPRVRARTIRRGGLEMMPLSRRPGGVQAYKMLVPPTRPETEPDLASHEGYEWIYVLNGRLNLRLGELDLILGPSEVAEFDTRTPHWFGSAATTPVELLVLFGPQGERMHVRARPRAR